MIVFGINCMYCCIEVLVGVCIRLHARAAGDGLMVAWNRFVNCIMLRNETVFLAEFEFVVDRWGKLFRSTLFFVILY